ncbi:hypothetical protein UlMin_012763 [Ulmus minor]
MRKWGKWVAEIREPNKCSWIWLAYDTAVFYLRGPSARLNFSELLGSEGGGCGCGCGDLSATFIRKNYIEVGARVDAHETALRHHHHHHHASAGEATELKPISRFVKWVDLNKLLDPKNSDGEFDWERN